MGWAAYKVTRKDINTGNVLGTREVIVPKVNGWFDITTGYKSLRDFLQYPDFPIEAHVIVHSNFVDLARNFGFGNIINGNDYLGEYWELNNGSKIYFNNSGSITIQAYTGKTISTFTVPSGACYPHTMPCIIGTSHEGDMSYGYMPDSGGNKGKVQWTSDLVPSRDKWWTIEFYKGATPIYQTTDPYGDGGESETGGGTGDFDNTSDSIDIPQLPAVSATDAGFITLFNPSATELHNLAAYMWSDLFDVNGWKKVFADPMQAILGLSIVPVSIPTSMTKPVKVGNISTDVSMGVAASQYITVDCGTLNVGEFWGAYLDYEPYTKAEIYLPYIGIHALSTDDIMGKSVHVVYHVDILSGSCCAYVKCGNSVLYSFVGQCSSSVPITGDNWTNVINGALSIAGSIGSMVATGGASAPSAIGNIASTAVNSMKPSIEKSGSMSGTGGMLGIQTPYLILTRPRQAVPRDQNKYIGYPAFVTAKLADLSGYTEIDSIHLENIGATEKELSEIENILKSGVIF